MKIRDKTRLAVAVTFTQKDRELVKPSFLLIRLPINNIETLPEGLCKWKPDLM